jgi:integrase
LRAAFEATALRDLSPAAIRLWLTGLTVKLKTIRNILTPMRNIFDIAVNDGVLLFNPLDRIKLDKLVTAGRRDSDFEADPFDAKEIAAILNACNAEPERNLLQFEFASGLRTSELIELRWKNIDFMKGIIQVRSARVERTMVKGTKTKAGRREVLMLPAAQTALVAQKKHSFLAGEHVFLNPRNGQPYADDSQIRNYIGDTSSRVQACATETPISRVTPTRAIC